MHEVHLIYNSAFTNDFFKIHILSVPLALSFPQVIEKEFLVTISIYSQRESAFRSNCVC